MRVMNPPVADWLRKRRRVVATVVVFGFLILSSWMVLLRPLRAAGGTLLCSTKAALSCDRALVKGIFDPHCGTLRVDRIVTGALRLASSL